METFASVWLSRAALAAAVIFAYSSVKVFTLNPRGPANRIAAVFNLVFAIWAIAAIFWYSAKDAAGAQFWYKNFNWTWCIFPPLGIHFNIRASRPPEAISFPKHFLQLLLLYLPALAFIVLIPRFVIVDLPEFHGGYWMVNPRINLIYLLYDLHFFLYTAVAVAIAFRAWRRATSAIESRRLAILVFSTATPLVLSTITDAAFLMLKIDFPNVAIFWILILSAGMMVTMNRYGFLSDLPVAEAPRILDALADIVVYVGQTGCIAWANRSAVLAMGGKTLHELKGKRPEPFLDEMDAHGLAAAINGNVELYEAMSEFGPLKLPVAIRIRHVTERRLPRGAVIMAVDLSSQHRLADKGLLLEEFIDNSMDGIVLTDSDGFITRWNGPMAEITGVPAAEAIGSQLWKVQKSLLPGRYSRDGTEPDIERSINKLLANPGSPFSRRVLEQDIQRKDGSKRKIQSNIFVIPSGRGPILAGILRDVTDEKRAAEDTIERIRKLDRAQKMEAVGSLSSGIAHDFNNTLSGIVGTLSLMRMSLEEGAYSKPTDIENELTMMERAAARAVSSVKRLLALTKKRPPEIVPFSLGEAAARVLEFAARSIDPSVRIEATELPKDALMSGDPGQVEQLLLNLVINAEQSMTIMRPAGVQKGGVIRVSIKRFKPDMEFLTANPQAKDIDYWLLSVKDDGVGIPQDIMARIFDPFYTTKPPEKSSGLGLPMVHSIAAQHGGFVDANSELGTGSEFLVYLPAGNVTPQAETPQVPARGSGTILVADDDEMPREIASAMLGALGYSTKQADSGETALRVFSASPGLWTAVLMDLRMTGISGDEAAKEMRKARPELPVVIASGYVPDGLLGGGDDFVFMAKPYSIRELGEALRKALARVD